MMCLTPRIHFTIFLDLCFLAVLQNNTWVGIHEISWIWTQGAID